jgi:hypothetical protein
MPYQPNSAPKILISVQQMFVTAPRGVSARPPRAGSAHAQSTVYHRIAAPAASSRQINHSMTSSGSAVNIRGDRYHATDISPVSLQQVEFSPRRQRRISVSLILGENARAT